MPGKKRPRAFVPRIVLGTATVAVIPACVLAACGSSPSGPATGTSDAQADGADGGPAPDAEVTLPGFDAPSDLDADPDGGPMHWALAVMAFTADADKAD